MLRAKRVHRDRKRQCRIDAAGQPQYDTGKAVLAHVVAHTQYERAINARFFRLQRDHRPRTRHGLVADEIDIDCEDIFFEMRSTLNDFAILIHDERAAIEYELILTADHVQVHDRQLYVLNALSDDALTALLVVERVRRSVDHHEQLRACRLRRAGGARLPNVFADQKRRSNAVEIDDAGVLAVLEIALLVEYRVVRQLLLAVVRERLTLSNEDRRIEDALGGVLGIADENCNPVSFRAYALDRRGDLPAQALVKQQVLRRIAAQRELGEEHDIGVEPLARVHRRVENTLCVAGDISDKKIELRQGEPECGSGHSVRMRTGGWSKSEIIPF